MQQTFYAANEVASIEGDPNGEIVVMSPTGFASSNKNVRVSRLLDEWAEADGRGVTTGRMADMCSSTAR